MDAAPWRVVGAQLTLMVRAQPRGGRDALDKVELLADGRAALKVRLKAPPVDGEANDALIRFLAKTLGLRQNEIAIVAGETARLKTLSLPAACEARLRAAIAGL